MPQMSSNRLLDKLLSPALRVARGARLSAAATRVNQSTRLGLEGWIVAVLVLAPFTLRTLLLLDQSLPLGAADAHGYLSDVAVSALAGVLLSALLRRLSPRARDGVAQVVLVGWTLVHAGNYEHVKTLGAPLQLTYATYMRDGVFFAGSALSLSRLGWVLVLLAVGCAGMFVAVRVRPGVLTWQSRAIGLLALALADAAWPASPVALAWRESDFMKLWMLPSSAKASGLATRSPLPREYRANVGADLSGTSTIAPRRGKPNVLLVILEGITGGSIPSIAAAHGITQPADMPELSTLASRNISFPTFLTNQRQTNRGEFALLCGQLDYLVSGTSRMTEYAREGGEPCLPRLLADQGYRTMYVQPAPLSFMMKDQFMAKAGFTDVIGHDYFKKAYARSNWGVDDRAFFEQAAVALRDLDAGGAPWFAALLTVGTHHPYTVPSDFRTGTPLDEDPHSRAIRYLDRALGAFVADLEASHMLDDTLLLVTSDESFGVNGYDDQTQLLSYNWGFLVARAPGEAARVVAEPHAQTDVALSIADYLGIGNTPFVGRSLFRSYPDDRKIVFANTYQQKIYWAGTREIVECNEALADCHKHVIGSPGLFGPQRKTENASGADVAPLEEMVARTTTHSTQPGEGRMPLMRDNAVVWNMGVDHQGLVFGGQYFTLEAGQELMVSMDATVLGSGTSVVLDSDLFARGMLYEVFPPPLYEGDRLRFQYVYAPGAETRNVEVRLNARRVAGNATRLLLQGSEMTVRPRTTATTGGVTTTFEVERARPMATYALGSGIVSETNREFVHGDCVSRRNGREVVARACPRGFLLFGPYAHVDAGSHVRVLFEVSDEKGNAELRGDLVSLGGQVVHARSEPARLTPGAGRVIEFGATVAEALDRVEARLALDHADADSELVIRRAVLEVFPPSGGSPVAK
jgi:sulfatase-like protein